VTRAETLKIDWMERERAFAALLMPYLSSVQAASLLEQWEAILSDRPELSGHPRPGRTA
jgi:hypothetical protein